MRVDERARRASRAIHRVIERPTTLDHFYLYEQRLQTRRRVGAIVVATCVAVMAGFVMIRAFGHADLTTPAGPSPTGSILYGKWDAKTQRSEWFTVHPDGSGVHDLGVMATCATWFPDGSKILTTNDAAVPGQALRPAIINPDGSGLIPLDATNDAGLNLGCGDVSPDGSRLVLEGFNEHVSGLNGIYTVRASDGGGLKRLTRSPKGFSDGDPDYSPDGSHIVFFRSRPGATPQGAGALFVMNADGADLRRITPWGFAFLGQSWSPDGQWIVFQRPYGQLFMVHPDGTGLHSIPLQLPGSSGAQNPVWSPDGAWIAFSLDQGLQADIFIVRPDGSGLQQVTHSSKVNLQTPEWGS